MDQINFAAGYFNPFSEQISNAGRKFFQINDVWMKVAVVAATLFAALITFPFGGIGGAAVFRFLVERITERALPQGERVKFANYVDGIQSDEITISPPPKPNLENLHAKWKLNVNSYGYAAELRPFVGQGDNQLDYAFGKALKHGCAIGSKGYYEGMYWMEGACGFCLKYPNEYQTFKSFKSYYIQYVDKCSTYYDHDGFRHMGVSTILARSKEAWEEYKLKKLKTVEIAPLDSYVFPFDADQLKSLLNEYKIGAIHCSSFVEDSTASSGVKSLGKFLHGYSKDTLCIYENHKGIGEISVRKDTFEIVNTFSNSKIQPIIDFIENVMKRSGSAGSARRWLRQMGSSYI